MGQNSGRDIHVTTREYVPLSLAASGRFIGMRHQARRARDEAERALLGGGEVVFDFGGIGVTQAFVDELVGVLILHHGPDLLQRIIFKNCSQDVRAIIEFVAADRCDQYHTTSRRSMDRGA
jgi:STAS-like domain of unknown function (DUF4325)